MTAIWNVYIEAHEWQCEPANDEARAAADRAEYPKGPMVPLAALDALAAVALKCANAYDETVEGEWGVGLGETETDESRAVREAVDALKLNRETP